jgi:hypothetical protein
MVWRCDEEVQGCLKIDLMLFGAQDCQGRCYYPLSKNMLVAIKQRPLSFVEGSWTSTSGHCSLDRAGGLISMV